MKQRHEHKMKRQGAYHKCSSCEFRCTTSALPQVKASPNSHRLVKTGEGVWAG